MLWWLHYVHLHVKYMCMACKVHVYGMYCSILSRPLLGWCHPTNSIIPSQEMHPQPSKSHLRWQHQPLPLAPATTTRGRCLAHTPLPCYQALPVHHCCHDVGGTLHMGGAGNWGRSWYRHHWRQTHNDVTILSMLLDHWLHVQSCNTWQQYSQTTIYDLYS